MSIVLAQLDVFDGPNIYYPQGGIAATVESDHALGDALPTTIKTWAQAVGVIIGYLRVQPTPHDAGCTTTVSYTCNNPAIGAAILEHSIADLAAAERGDEDWDHDDALFELRRRRMREDPTLPLLQLRAETQGRGLPLLRVGDGTLQIGTGRAAWRFDPAQLSVGLNISPPWEQISVVPLVAVGGVGAEQVATRIADDLESPAEKLVRVFDGTFTNIQAALLDQDAACVVVALDSESALRHGIPFSRCAVAVVLELETLPQPQALAAGLPALVADQTGSTILLAADARSRSLAQRTAANVVLLQPHTAIAQPPIDPFAAAVAASVQATLDAN